FPAPCAPSPRRDRALAYDTQLGGSPEGRPKCASGRRRRNRLAIRYSAGTCLASCAGMLLTILIILLILALFGGGYGSRRGWGYYGWSPLGLIILIVLILALTGNLNF